MNNIGEFTGRVAFVTGGGRGIGRACAVALARAGARVALSARTATQLESVRAEIMGAGGTAVACPADVTRPDAVAAALDAAEKALGPCDTLVHAAGAAESAPLASTDDALWARMLDANLTGAFHVLRAVLPRMAGRKFGRAVVIASIAARTGAPYIAAYTAAKHGVLGLVRATALEFVTKGVTVNAVCPGYVDTDMTTQSVARIAARTGRAPAEARAALEQMSPAKRLFTADEVAHAATFLLARASGGITGQGLNVCGGTVES